MPRRSGQGTLFKTHLGKGSGPRRSRRVSRTRKYENPSEIIGEASSSHGGQLQAIRPQKQVPGPSKSSFPETSRKRRYKVRFRNPADPHSHRSGQGRIYTEDKSPIAKRPGRYR
ncbi:unnamed protein product [Allacma fusca]|uniref:Uncharacterized protein n=1 Tax=Allacma fusca TaxID=39272 RepID=A0A8J2Q1L4_9HEXA|nr:unnamed protein product [Allacma fusca]